MPDRNLKRVLRRMAPSLTCLRHPLRNLTRNRLTDVLEGIQLSEDYGNPFLRPPCLLVERMVLTNNFRSGHRLFFSNLDSLFETCPNIEKSLHRGLEDGV